MWSQIFARLDSLAIGSVEDIFNRPGVAGAVLLTPLWHFSSKPTKHHYAQTVRGKKHEIFRECLTPTICYMSGVRFQVSCVRCHM